MVKSPLWLRVAAPCLALGLGGGYVWIRHQKAEAAEIQAQAAEAEAVKQRPMVLPGSKAPARFMDAEVIDDGGKVLPGSKIGEVLRYRVNETEESGEPPVKEAEPPQVLPGSKSDIIRLEERRILPGSKSAGIIDPEDLRQRSGPAQGTGNRAINRNNIDEVLNNPNRVQPPVQKEEPKPQQEQQPAKPAEP